VRVNQLAAAGASSFVGGDLVRRTVRAEMDANCEAPDERRFRSDPLKLSPGVCRRPS